MSDAIKLSQLLLYIKSFLKEKTDIETIIGLEIPKPLVNDEVILLSPTSALKEEIGNGVWNKELRIEITVIKRTANLYDDTSLCSFLDRVEKVESVMQNEFFRNEIIETKVEIENIDIFGGDRQDFLNAALLVYTAKIKAV